MQQNKGNKLFLQEALDLLASPKQLDQMMQVVNPRAWLPLTTVGFVAAATWSIFGRIPLEVNGQGVLIRPRNVVQLQAIQDGQILTLDLKPGDRVKKGEIIGTIDHPQIRQQLEQERLQLAQLQTQHQETSELQQQALALKKQNLLKQRAVLDENLIEETRRKIAQLELDLAKKSKLISQDNGRVLEVAAVSSQAIKAGTRLASIETDNPNSKMVSLVYLNHKDGKQVKPGMTVQVTPSMVKRERYGGIVGKVTQVSSFPVTNQDIAVIIGNENIANSIAESVLGQGSAPI